MSQHLEDQPNDSERLSMQRIHLLNQDRTLWCKNDDPRERAHAVDVETALAQHRHKVCQDCCVALSCALRGPDGEVEIEFHEGLFSAVIRLMDPLIKSDPTNAQVFNVSATLLQAAASAWLRFHQDEEMKAFLPFNEERFSKLAWFIFTEMRKSLLAHNN